LTAPIYMAPHPGIIKTMPIAMWPIAGGAALCRQLDWYPSILHGHDWQAALISAYFYHYWRYQTPFSNSATTFTIHNLSYQGIFPASYFALTHLPPQAFAVDGLEFWGNCNFLKAGLVYSDLLTTVSPRYSQEIQQPELGAGLDGVLRDRRGRLIGILNGVDSGCGTRNRIP